MNKRRTGCGPKQKNDEKASTEGKQTAMARPLYTEARALNRPAVGSVMDLRNIKMLFQMNPCQP
jgi:hypothetical protein